MKRVSSLLLLSSIFVLTACTKEVEVEKIVEVPVEKEVIVEVEKIIPSNFAEQCLAAGLDFEYVEKNVIPVLEPTDSTAGTSVDSVATVSGSNYYKDGSYLNIDFLAERMNAQYYFYKWETPDEDETGVTTLEEAITLENAKHTTEMFPSDGNEYILKEYHNAWGTRTITTVNDDGTPNSAIFGFGLEKIEDKWYASLYIGKNNTLKNLVNNEDAYIVYYEYDHASSEKFVRNRGAKLLGEIDYTLTTLYDNSWYVPVEQDETLNPNTVDWSLVGAGKVYIEITDIYTLG